MDDTQRYGKADIVRRDFIDAYAARWNCSQEYAEGLMQHVETGAADTALADFYQQLCDLHMYVLLKHGGQVAQGVALAVRAIVELIPEGTKQAAIVEWAEKAAPNQP